MSEKLPFKSSPSLWEGEDIGGGWVYLIEWIIQIKKGLKALSFQRAELATKSLFNRQSASLEKVFR